MQQFFANQDDKKLFNPKHHDLTAAHDKKICKRLVRVQELEEKNKASRKQQYHAQ